MPHDEVSQFDRDTYVDHTTQYHKKFDYIHPDSENVNNLKNVLNQKYTDNNASKKISREAAELPQFDHDNYKHIKHTNIPKNLHNMIKNLPNLSENIPTNSRNVPLLPGDVSTYEDKYEYVYDYTFKKNTYEYEFEEFIKKNKINEISKVSNIHPKAYYILSKLPTLNITEKLPTLQEVDDLLNVNFPVDETLTYEKMLLDNTTEGIEARHTFYCYKVLYPDIT